MTEKQFKNVEEELDWGTVQYFTYNGKKINDNDLENLVNHLLNENEQLKQRINSRLHFYRELYDSTKDIIAKRVVEDLEDILK